MADLAINAGEQTATVLENVEHLRFDDPVTPATVTDAVIRVLTDLGLYPSPDDDGGGPL